MSDAQFHETRVGRTFYEHTIPKLVEQLERLNKNLERIAERLGSASGDSSPMPMTDDPNEREEHRQ